MDWEPLLRQMYVLIIMLLFGCKCYIGPNTHIGSDTIIKDNVNIGASSTIGESSFYHYYEDNCLQEFKGIGRVKLLKKMFL